MKALQIFNYNESPVTFRDENGIVYINATQMAKPFGKRVNDYLGLPNTKTLIEAIESTTRKSGSSNYQAVITKACSPETGGGTWMIEILALDFAQWLSVDFRLWCNDRIKELLTTGSTQLLSFQVPTTFAEALRLAADLQETNDRLAIQNGLQKKELQVSVPKVEYFDTVLQSTSTYCTDQIAKELDMTAISLNKKLAFLEVQFKRGMQWVLTTKYLSKGYTKTKTHTHTGTDGLPKTTMNTVWTEAGRLFIHNLLTA